MEAYREFVVTILTTLKHIGSTHSTLMISEVKTQLLQIFKLVVILMPY